MVSAPPEQQPATRPGDADPFADLDVFAALPRVAGLALSPDGSRLVVGVATLRPDGTGRGTALWQVDPRGQAEPRRLTRSSEGESAAAFACDGSLLFTSTRPVPPGALLSRAAEDAPERPGGAKPDPEPPLPALWQLPLTGEARPVAARPGGITAVHPAADVPVFAVVSPTLTDAGDAADDQRRRTARATGKVSAILHTGYPVRYWDADLGPAGDRLLLATLPGEDTTATLRDLTPDAGVHALREATVSVIPDGSGVVCDWRVAEAHGASRQSVVVFDGASGQRRTLLDGAAADPAAVVDHHDPAVSPTGALVAAIRETRSDADNPGDLGLELVPLAGDGPPVRLAAGWDRWPHSVPVWAHDAAALFVTADSDGAGPIFRVSLDPTAPPVRLTGDDASYSDVVVARDGSAIYALRSTWDAPPHRSVWTPRTRTSPRSCWAVRRRPPRCPAGWSFWTRCRPPTVPVELAAGVARRRGRQPPGTAGAVGARRAAGQLERLELALDAVAAGRAGIRRAAARSRPFHRVRARLRPPRLGPLG